MSVVTRRERIARVRRVEHMQAAAAAIDRDMAHRLTRRRAILPRQFEADRALPLDDAGMIEGWHQRRPAPLGQRGGNGDAVLRHPVV